jgi:HK97 family phage major capsid protein
MTLTTAPGSGQSILTAEQDAQLVELPLRNESVAMRVSNLISTNAHSIRVPLLVGDVTNGGFVPEGEEVPVGGATLGEVDIVPAKTNALTVLSRELIADSEPGALTLVGQSLVATLVKVIDAAYFASSTVDGPAGLLSITPSNVDAGDAWQTLDAFEGAKSISEQHGTVVDNFVCSPQTALALSVLKANPGVGSNVPLLQPDPTAPASRTISSGVPLLTSPSIGANIVWVIPQNRVVFALREGITVEKDTSVFFTSQRVALMATARVGWKVLDELAISKITLSP